MSLYMSSSTPLSIIAATGESAGFFRLISPVASVHSSGTGSLHFLPVLTSGFSTCDNLGLSRTELEHHVLADVIERWHSLPCLM